MFKVLRYLKKSKAAVAAIIALLILQAYCDLALPQFTADIVDVGIGQGGIENAVPKRMRGETMEKLASLMKEEEALLRSSYRQLEDGSYELAAEEEAVSGLSESLEEPMAKLVLLTASEGTDMDLEGMSGSMITQMAVNGVKAEYEALGISTASVQTEYLLGKGGGMLALSVLMMAAAILIIHPMPVFVFTTLITPPAPTIGAYNTMRRSITDTICICWMSLVLLVIRDAVENLSISVSEKETTLWNVSREILTGIPVIRAFSREKFEEERFDKANRELMRTQLFTNRVMTFMMPVMMMIMNGVAVMIVWFGAMGVDAGNLQVGDMLAFITYTMQIVMAFLMITMISIMLPRAGVAAERIEEVLHMENSIHDKEVTMDESLKDVEGVVRFEKVSFKYPGADENALEEIDFAASPGETTAIIGSTGCGKSTLIRLIPRFYDVTEGRITIDGIDIRDISQHKLHDMLGYVPQKGVLFSGDIESNIKFGGDFITDRDMEEAARIAQAMEFIESKPEKFASGISQGGTNVSGGQKQRLSIARAIAKHPKICLFDDSFSALDYKTDVTLRKALSEKLRDATVIIVAQRISTILHADKIIVLDEGRIAGIGRHEELLASCGAYQEIARSQLSEDELKGGRA